MPGRTATRPLTSTDSDSSSSAEGTHSSFYFSSSKARNNSFANVATDDLTHDKFLYLNRVRQDAFQRGPC
jgi:hypothetical protein